MSNFVTLQTTLPAHFQVYLRQLGVVHYKYLHAVHEDMVNKFLRAKPWEAEFPLPWRGAPSRYGVSSAGCSVANVALTKELAERVEEVLKELNLMTWKGHESRGITRKTFLYTAVYWWVTYVYPQKH